MPGESDTQQPTVDFVLRAAREQDIAQTFEVNTLHTRFWYNGPFIVDITSIVAYSGVNAASETTPEFNSYLPLIQR
ncbi:MAG: hypothetical protein DYG89_35060 [Caldilinea sp. CFX5]|nr:hypothetical protein [Caldilinea sp. CFX5]